MAFALQLLKLIVDLEFIYRRSRDGEKPENQKPGFPLRRNDELIRRSFT